MRTARQIAASKRNIAKAQIASARARKGKKRSAKSQHTYGTGRTGRKNTRRALYGSRRHGISPVQYQRRQQRAAKWKRRAGYAATGVAIGVMAYNNLDSASKAKLRADARDYGAATRNIPRYGKALKGSYKFNRAAGMGRGAAAKRAGSWAGVGVAAGYHQATRSMKYRHRK